MAHPTLDETGDFTQQLTLQRATVLLTWVSIAVLCASAIANDPGTQRNVS